MLMVQNNYQVWTSDRINSMYLHFGWMAKEPDCWSAIFPYVFTLKGCGECFSLPWCFVDCSTAGDIAALDINMACGLIFFISPAINLSPLPK